MYLPKLAFADFSWPYSVNAFRPAEHHTVLMRNKIANERTISIIHPDAVCSSSHSLKYAI